VVLFWWRFWPFLDHILNLKSPLRDITLEEEEEEGDKNDEDEEEEEDEEEDHDGTKYLSPRVLL
jgi:hypothetical protein